MSWGIELVLFAITKSWRISQSALITESYMILESGRHVMGDRTGSICHYEIMAN